ncbi:MAG: DEAD/DEAH box helicase [Rhodobacteraceae bacterium]|jgi:ATP-dependent RNA helicase RhlE|nr:DEAD/DEAH box helicase [Paracoccaceae bacterium]
MKATRLTRFDDLGLTPRLLERIAAEGHAAPTPIQTRAIPEVLAGRDVLGLAQTGTGKTLAFGLPLVQMLTEPRQRPAPGEARALILAPTRELAGQIATTLGALTRGGPLRVGLVVGGASLNAQAERLARGTDILVATPGRLIDHLDRGSLRLDATRALVLDEADQMLDLGFIHALRRIARVLPQRRQTLLFSATMPRLMDEVAAAFLRTPVRIEVSPPGRAVERIDQGVHFIGQGDKARLLEEYLTQHPGERALVFARTKHGAEKLMKLLVGRGFAAGSIHGNKSQGQRDRALAGFRAGELAVLVATDVAARGIDIPDVRHVYNYDMPNVPEIYVHRIGRTARAGASGRAVAFCAPAEMGELRAVETAMRATIPVVGGTAWAPAAVAAAEAARAAQRSGAGAPAGGRPARKPQAAPKAAAAKGGRKAPAPAPATEGSVPQRRRPRRARAA